MSRLGWLDNTDFIIIILILFQIKIIFFKNY